MSDLVRDREGQPPPPSPALLAAVGAMRPVRPRVPARTLLALAGLALVVPALALLLDGPRQDLPALPLGWVIAVGLAWAVAAGALLATAVLPRRKEVLANPARAGRAALVATVALLLIGLFGTATAPGHTVVPESLLSSRTWECLLFGVKVTVPLLLGALLLLRRAFPIGAAQIAAALGAAGGALGGLALHLVCPYGGGLHVGVAHAGGLLVGAAVGMVALPRFLRP